LDLASSRQEGERERANEGEAEGCRRIYRADSTKKTLAFTSFSIAYSVSVIKQPSGIDSKKTVG
jgi:hypothetical protein